MGASASRLILDVLPLDEKVRDIFKPITFRHSVKATPGSVRSTLWNIQLSRQINNHNLYKQPV